MLKGKKIIICVTSSIASIEIPKLVRELLRQEAIVHCVLSRSAQNIIHPNSLQWASKNKVITQITGECEHILHTYHRKADLLLVAPATNNIIAKIAHGLSDCPSSTFACAALGAQIPIMVVPCMHLNMYNKLTSLNIEKLKKLSIDIIAPKIEENKAKFPDRDKIIDILNLKFTSKDLRGKKIIVTAGSTMEEIDPVRYITNKSSGKMGIAIANEAFKRGAEIILIRGNTTVNPKYNYTDIKIKSANEMYQAIKEQIKADIIIHSAAVSDFTIDRKTNKIKSTNKINLELTPTTKILEKIKVLNKNIFLIGFKAEHNVSDQTLVHRAYQKLLQAKADLIVANDVSRPHIGFEHDTNECLIVTREAKIIHIPLAHKKEIANKILDLIP